MREVLQRLTKMAFGYGIAEWLRPLIALVMTPILTRILSPADYGIAEYILTLNSAVGILALLGVPQALTTHFNDRNDHAWKARVTGSALALTIPLSATAGLNYLRLCPGPGPGGIPEPDLHGPISIDRRDGVLGVVGTVLVTASRLRCACDGEWHSASPLLSAR